jgi:hypothetical protein
VRLAAGLLGVVLVATVALRSVEPETMNHDVGWILDVAGRILDGAAYPSDWVDVNPPGVFWLHVPAVALARAIGSPPFLVFGLLVLAAAFAAVAASVRLGAQHFAPLRGECGWLTGAALATVVTLGPGYAYGQREHLFSIAALPYLTAAAIRLERGTLSRRACIAIGAAAGIGFAIKPFFLLAWLAVEGLLVRRLGRDAPMRLESIALFSVLAVYSVSLLAFAPEYFGVITEAAALGLDRYDMPVSWLFWNRAVGVGIAAACAFAVWRPPERALHGVLLTAAAALWAGAAAQRRGWNYHFLPLELAASCSLVFLAMSVLVSSRPAESVWRPRTLAIGWLVVLAGSATAAAIPLVREPSPRAAFLARLAEAVREGSAGRPVLSLSTAVWPTYPVLNAIGVASTSRYSCLWQLPAFEFAASRPRDAEARFLDAFFEDLSRRPPALIVVDRSRVKQGFASREFDLLAYFGRDPRMAPVLAEFGVWRDVGPYLLLRRRSAP